MRKTRVTRGRIQAAALFTSLFLIGGAANASDLKSLTVCADPGNMPLSNQRGEGFENKIAELIGKSLGTGVHYYWRPSIERGLMRTTLSEGNCDLWMDMASDTEGAVVLAPLYRSTFVLAYRNDKHIAIKTLDDPILKTLRIGVFQVSAIRQALSEHRIVDNTVIHYLSHNADIVPENQPSFQVQRVIDGTLDVAAAWGPMAGYYQKVVGAPLTILPVNLLENEVPMEFDMTLAVPRGRPDIKAAIEQALRAHKAEIRQILVDFGVPLVACEACTVSGDIPSHGPYKPVAQPVKTAGEIAREHAEKMAALKKWLAQGANPDEELHNAITANDVDRVRYLLSLGSTGGAHVNARDGEGNTPLINATRFGFVDLAAFLVEHGAEANMPDRGGWTALMFAAWGNNAAMVTMLVAHGARLDHRDGSGITPLALAAQNGRLKSAQALIAAGADVNAPVAKGGYTPLMLAALSGSSDLAALLIDRGARVNDTNPGGVSALMIATAGNRSQVAALLLKSGADVNLKSEDGRTALEIARTNGNDAMVRLLEEAAQKGATKSG